MYEIRKRIETNHYTSEESCINDLKLMFNNCRTFNEDGSIIFDDSIKLEKIVLDKYNRLKPNNNTGINGSNAVSKPQTKSANFNISRLPKSPEKETNNHQNEHPNNQQNHQPLPKQTHQHQQNNQIHQQQQQPKQLSNHQQTTQNHSNNNNRTPVVNNSNHNSDRNHSINSNVISQSSNGFPSEDSNSNSNILPSSIINEGSLSEIPFQNDISMDSCSSMQEKPHKRSKRDHDLQPKKRVLTGYIIFAAETRKEYVDKNPNQEFGFISRLIGADWKALPRDLKQKYELRAQIQNEKAAKLEQARLAAAPTTPGSTNMNSSPAPTSTKKQKLSHQPTGSSSSTGQASTTSQQASSQCQYTSTGILTESATQTTPARFVQPPNRMPYNYTEIYRRFLGDEFGEISYEHVYGKQNGSVTHHLDDDSAKRWLGAGTGRHKSTEDALWALRDFMLQDTATMRWSLLPYQSNSNDGDGDNS